MRPIRETPWWAAVFGLAFAARLAFVLVVDEPLLYTHQYNYFSNALHILEHSDPWGYVLRSDEWHTWSGHWTMAPLYHLFLAGVFAVLGVHLLPLQILQCALDGVSAVMVGALGRRLAGPRGAWAGAAYALYWPAIEMPSRTMTENLHTVLLVSGVAILAGANCRARRAAAGGLLLGLSALARAVSAAFIPVAALVHLRNTGWIRGRLAALALVASGALAILPWTLRNVFVVKDPVLIETVAFWNLWTDNAFVDPDRYDRQAHGIAKLETPAERRAEAVRLAWLGVRRSPGQFVEKVWDNFRHFIRPEGLHQLLTAEDPRPAWRHAVAVLFDDLPLVAAGMLCVVFLVAGPPSLVRRLLLAWSVYYLFFVVIVFHNEIRYRSAFVPFAFAGAFGGLAALREKSARPASLRLGLAIAALLGLMMVGPFAAPGWRALDSTWAVWPARAAIARGELGRAEAAALDAARRDWHAARPWLLYGGWLARAGQLERALDAFRRARMRREDHWLPHIAVPPLLSDLGRFEAAEQAWAEEEPRQAQWEPWIVLELAWRVLPPPRGDEIRLARRDLGAVRGFLQPLGDHRWSRHRAKLRLHPTEAAPAYDVTLYMGSPEPSPFRAPTVTLKPTGSDPVRLTLASEVRPYVLRARPDPRGAVHVTIDAPTWNRAGEPAEQGIRVDRMTVAPVR